ncbi:LacI family DNA-binding transcriptional regulator [Bifidobacterium oedipodis]|uniref:Transcriptional regulator, LacI family n=1 Tax=Bifidobacterium oedipodis TaxID=2675322 RepID=A0A7Y0HRN5_9BIFI|nr:LacI family DNA-binding transcriptional regulator [Bifidobacterium sp. DSM 109957]NMM93061.1 transcriptional regulator, LacI family [Bifidobacterium sp. DSM 109957]
MGRVALKERRNSQSHRANHIETVARRSTGLKKVTIRDIAKAAGVAPSTVSRAFNSTERLSSDTTRRIYEIAERMGYVLPNADADSAQDRPVASLRRLVGIVVTDLTDPYCAAVTHAVEHECFGHGFSLVVSESRDSLAWERMALDTLLRQCDGVMMLAPRMGGPELREAAGDHPLVLANRNVKGVSNIVVDLSGGVGQAVNLFAVRGYERITYLAGPSQLGDDAARWRQLESSCEEQGLELRRLWPGEPTFEGGRDYVDKYLEDPTGAVIAYNDQMALGFMAALRERGFTIPDDCSVIGFNDDLAARTSMPPLTSVRMSADELGAGLARLLLHRLERPQENGEAASYAAVTSSLVLRGSVGKATNAIRGAGSSAANQS